MTMNTLSLPWAEDVGDDGANDALLDDLLTFLDDGPSAPVDDVTSLDSHSDSGSVDASPRTSPAPAFLPAPKRKRPSKPKQGCPIKRTLDALRDEADQLTETLGRLRGEILHTPSRRSITEAALTERYKRRRAEKECEQLRDAVYAQALFLKGLQSVFSAPPSLVSGLNLCRHLHHYTRLPRERTVRWNEYAALSQETRLQRAMDIVSRETQALTSNERGGFDTSKPLLSSTVDMPFVHYDVINNPNGFGVTTTSVYALDTLDMSAVVRGACVAVRDILVRCTSYRCTNVKGLIVDPEASSSSANNILYRVMGIHHKSLRDDSDELSVESRIVTLYKETDDYAVVLWDYVDDDELHPTTDAEITRQAIGACLIRREMCDDGVERSVVRIMNTRQYRFHEQLELATRDKLRRFQHCSLSTNRENELLFRGIVVDSVAKEEAAYARIVGTV